MADAPISKTTGPGPARPRGRILTGLGRLVSALFTRVYAVALIGIVLWLSWKAFFYLVEALVLPTRPPPQIVDIPTRLNEMLFSRPRAAFEGVRATENPRSPLSHYHRLDNWYQLDRMNDCTQSGCHAPLPHGKNNADRAFLNMHATSIHCGVCHMHTDQRPLAQTWYDVKTGAALPQAPALLRAYAWLTSPRIKEASGLTGGDQKEIVLLLRTAAQEAEGDPALVNLAEHLSAVRPESVSFTRLLKVATDTLPHHFRGEYGAKLALVDVRTKKPVLGNPDTEEAVRQYLAQRDALGDEEKGMLLKRVHPLQRDPTLHCTECHRAEGGLVDFHAAGYPPTRVQAIVSPLVMQAIEHVVEGRPFYMPGFLGPLEDKSADPGHGSSVW